MFLYIMNYIDCCKSRKKNKKCRRVDGKIFLLQRKFSKKNVLKVQLKDIV